MKIEVIITSLKKRLSDGLTNCNYNRSEFTLRKKFILNQAYIDGLLSTPPETGKPLKIVGIMKNVEVTVSFSADDLCD